MKESTTMPSAAPAVTAYRFERQQVEAARRQADEDAGWLKEYRDAYRGRLLAAARKSFEETGIWFLACGGQQKACGTVDAIYNRESAAVRRLRTNVVWNISGSAGQRGLPAERRNIMQQERLAPGEVIVGSWHVYMGGEGPTAAKVTGKLHVTNRNVHFEQELALQENAAAELSNRRQGYERLDQCLSIPFKDIREVRITKKLLILKSLHIVLTSGQERDIHFGVASPEKALDAISRGMNVL